MAVKRAGLFEAPTAVNSIVPVNQGVADASDMWRALGESARAIQTRLQPSLDRAAEAQARGDFAAGETHLRQSWLHEDEAYNNAMLQSWAARAVVDVGQRALAIESEAGDDPEAFDAAFDAARSEFIANAPPDFAPHMGALLDREYAEARQRIGQRRRNAALEHVGADVRAALDFQEARGAAYTDMTAPEYQAWVRDYTAMIGAATQNPLSGISPEEGHFRLENTLSRHQANAAGYTAEQIYEDGGGNAESAERAIAFLEEFSRNPSLTLTEAQRDAFFGEGRRRIAARERERQQALRELRADLRAERTEAREDIRDSLAEMEARARVFAPLDDAEIDDLRQRVAGVGTAAMVRQFNTLVTENGARRALHGRSVVEMEAALDSWQAEAAAGGDRAAEAATALRAGRAYVDAVRSGDPLDVAQMHFDTPAPGLDGGPGPRIRFAEQAAAAIGADRPTYFSRGEREQLAGAVRAGGEQALSLAGEIVRAAMAEGGPGLARARTMLEEVSRAGAPGLMEAGGVLALGGERARNTARYITEAQRLRGVEGYAPPDLPGVSDANERTRIANERMPADLSPEFAAQTRSAADLIFEGLVAEDRGRLQRWRRVYDTAVNAALGAVQEGGQMWGGVATLDGGERQIIPNWLRADQARNVREALNVADYTRAGGGKPPRNGALRDWRNARLRWTGEAGRYLLVNEIDGVEHHYESEPGVPYVLDLNRLRETLAERRPDAVRR